MTPEEARLNLDACTLRPGDAEAEARVLAGDDAALGAWVEKRSAFDEQAATAFNASPVPLGLNERLLAAMMAEAPTPVSKPALMPWLALAAVIALSAVGWWWNAQPAVWESQAFAVVSGLNSGTLPLDEFSSDLGHLKAVLAQANVPVPEGLPQDLTAHDTLGCKVIEIGGRPASVVCFKVTADSPAHLVTFQISGLKGAPTTTQPLFAQKGDWHMATWRSGDRGYYLATKADGQTLRGLFALLMQPGFWGRLV